MHWSNFLQQLGISKSVISYLERIEKETGRGIIFKRYPIGNACFKYDKTNIIIGLNKDKLYNNPDIDRIMAHEATHAFLQYKKKYCCPDPDQVNTPKEGDILSYITTMINDIVVNKILQDKGFPPFTIEYINTLTKYIQMMYKSESFYNLVNKPRDVVFIWLVLRYITAWGFLQYYDLDVHSTRIIKKFLEIYKKKLPEEFNTADKVKEIIIQNGIFTSEGQNKAMEEVFKLLMPNRQIKLIVG